jgi:hypothetical protein
MTMSPTDQLCVKAPVGAVCQLHQQLIQFQPRYVRKTQPASRVGGAGAARHFRDRR